MHLNKESSADKSTRVLALRELDADLEALALDIHAASDEIFGDFLDRIADADMGDESRAAFEAVAVKVVWLRDKVRDLRAEAAQLS